MYNKIMDSTITISSDDRSFSGDNIIVDESNSIHLAQLIRCSVVVILNSSWTQLALDLIPLQ